MLTAFSGRRPSQDEFELRSFIGLMAEHKVASYCEIGAREGDTFHEVVTTLTPLRSALAVDLPGGLWGKVTTGRALVRACEDLTRRGFHVKHLFGDSRDVDVQLAVLNDGPFDAILIDGDHTYEGVRADWENYRALGKLIAFHDIVGHDQSERVTGRAVEVPRLWAEIKASGVQTVEFIAPGSAMGIGVVIQS